MYTVYHITTISGLHVFGVSSDMQARLRTLITSPPALFMVSGGDVDSVEELESFDNIDHAVRTERRLVALYAGKFGIHRVRSLTLELDKPFHTAADVEHVKELMFIADIERTLLARVSDAIASLRITWSL